MVFRFLKIEKFSMVVSYFFPFLSLSVALLRLLQIAFFVTLFCSLYLRFVIFFSSETLRFVSSSVIICKFCQGLESIKEFNRQTFAG